MLLPERLMDWSPILNVLLPYIWNMIYKFHFHICFIFCIIILSFLFSFILCFNFLFSTTQLFTLTVHVMNTLYRKKWGLPECTLAFLFWIKNIDCSYSLEPSRNKNKGIQNVINHHLRNAISRPMKYRIRLYR